MTDDKDEKDIEGIKVENDKMIMKFYGLDYEKLFPEHQDES
jgi:hypothetical protein